MGFMNQEMSTQREQKISAHKGAELKFMYDDIHRKKVKTFFYKLYTIKEKILLMHFAVQYSAVNNLSS